MTTDRVTLHDEGEEPPPPGTKAAAAVRWVLIGLAILAAVWSVGSYVASRASSPGSGDPGAQGSGEIYRCPMHPAIVSDRPGDCPICNMTLQKVDRSESDTMTAGTSQVPGLTTVVLTEDKVQKAGVSTALVERQTISDPVRTVASIAADETRLAKVQTRFSGWIETLRVNQTGQKVSKGDVLAEIFSRELFTAQQEFLNAARWSDEGGSDVSGSLRKQARQRLELLGIAPAEIDAIEKKGEPIRALPIRSPVSGHVTFKGAVAGVFVEPGAELFEIADLTRVWAWAEIYERDLARVAQGQKATLSVAALPEQRFEGKVTFLQPTLDPRTRTVRARIELANPKLALRPGMYANVEIAASSREGLVVPRDALVDTGERQYVFVEIEARRYQPRAVRAGARSGERLLILDGLSEGERVVTGGNFLVDSESRLRASAASASESSVGRRTDIPIDREKYPEKYEQFLQCELAHRGMGTMEEDCKRAIPQPWK